jgi:hypothetical protein
VPQRRPPGKPSPSAGDGSDAGADDSVTPGNEVRNMAAAVAGGTAKVQLREFTDLDE